jgi:hypothetical protein
MSTTPFEPVPINKQLRKSLDNSRAQKRMMLVSQMILPGIYSYADIAGRLNESGEFGEVTEQTVAADAQRLRKLWQENSQRNTQEVIQQELAKFDALELAAFESLAMDPLHKTEYMDQILRIHDRRAKLLGVGSANVKISGDRNHPLELRVTDMSDEELAQIVASEGKRLAADSANFAEKSYTTVPAKGSEPLTIEGE